MPEILVTTPPNPKYRTGESRRIQASFIQNDAGNVLRWMITLNSEILATGDTDTIDYIDNSNRVGNLNYVITVDYNDGPIKYDSSGNPIPGHIEDGSLVTNIIYTYEMVENFFYVVSNSDIDPAELIDLSQYTHIDREVIPGDEVNIPVPENSKGIGILVLNGVNVTKIIDTNFNVNAIDSFSLYYKQYTTNDEVRTYKLYVLNSLVGLTQTTYKVVM